jgi:hypothetical protein
MSHQAEAYSLLSIALKGSKSPCILSSFGKDSLAVIEMATAFGVRRVLYLEDRDEIVDVSHIHRIVQRYQLEVTYLHSGRAILYFIQGKPLLLGFPFVTRQLMLPIPTNIDPYEPDKPFTCADDRLRASHGAPLEFDTDLLIMGFKLADWDGNTCRVIVDKLPPEAKVKYMANYRPVMDLAPGVKAVFPLLDWSHKQVWDFLDANYIEASSLMYHGRERRPHANPVCYRCHDPNGPALVECPKTGKSLMNLGHFVPNDRLADLARLGVISHDDAALLGRNHG